MERRADLDCFAEISVIKMKGSSLGVVLKSFALSSKIRLVEALKLFIAVDNTRAFVTMGELAQFRNHFGSSLVYGAALARCAQELVWWMDKRS